jgi:hypothetical protein
LTSAQSIEGRHNRRLGSYDSSIFTTKREVADRNEGISSHVYTAKRVGEISGESQSQTPHVNNERHKVSVSRHVA